MERITNSRRTSAVITPFTDDENLQIDAAVGKAVELLRSFPPDEPVPAKVFAELTRRVNDLAEGCPYPAAVLRIAREPLVMLAESSGLPIPE